MRYTAVQAVSLAELKEQAQRLPDRCGVYLMKDELDVIIYIGKAGNLKRRVGSYFSGSKDVKTHVLVNHVASFDHITTRNEYEALILENTLIKKWKPRYNINLKDGKTYPVIRITNEKFPRIFRTRRIVEDGSEYYGPYPNVTTLDVYLDLIEKLHPLRKCRGPLAGRRHPCLYYHIHRCSAPCVGAVTPEEYARSVAAVRRMLTGSIDELVDDLRRRMDGAAEELQFEQAAKLRDALAAVEYVSRQQEVVDFDDAVRDYVAVVERDGMCSFAVFHMRTGRLIGREMLVAERYDDPADAFEQFLLQYYADQESLPDRLYVPDIVDVGLIERYFREERGSATEVKVPEETRDISILTLARENALEELMKRQHGDRTAAGLEELKLALSLESAPRRIEGFDISQLGGKYSVASMVSFLDGKPDKELYRRFHVKSLNGRVDDFAAMREIIARRYTRVLNESLGRPDLILVDGGRGQVSAARAILCALGFDAVPVVGLAKREEEIYLPETREPLRLPEGSGALRILQHVRDEAHRFATTFNKRLREKDVKLSILEEVDGVGPKRAARLLREFGSLAGIGKADPERIARSGGLPRTVADALIEHLHGSRVGEKGSGESAGERPPA